MDIDFMARLERLRLAFGLPMALTSAYRTVEHERRAGRSGYGAHTLGQAVDFSIRAALPWEVLRLIGLARNHGFTGIGLYATWIHLDDAPAGDGRVRPTFWWSK
jgi:uncharacterized protein YcbK (DUF882 family)